MCDVVSKLLVERLLTPVVGWHEHGGDAWQVDLEYWARRRQLIEVGEQFAGHGADLLSQIDTAMDSFSPDPDRGPDQIDEDQLRQEVGAAIGGLRKIGLLR
jgi:hypothetical protein